MSVDRVHYADVACEGDHDEFGGPGWYFWDETLASRLGPWPTEADARTKESLYYEWLNSPPVASKVKK